MQVVVISGSHRQGNTDSAVRYLAKQTAKKGHLVRLIDLKKTNLRFSTGDSKEYYTGKPAISDAMGNVHKTIMDSDLFILASPNYFSNVSAFMKNFIDRTNPYYCNHDYKGKKAALLVVSASSGKSPKLCLANLQEFCRIHKMNVLATKILIAEHSKDFQKNKKLQKEIDKFADKILVEK